MPSFPLVIHTPPQERPRVGTYPVNRVADGDRRVSEPGVRCRLCLCIVPRLPAVGLDGVKLGETHEAQSPAIVIQQKALDADGFRCVDDDLLGGESGDANNTDDGLLTVESFLEVFELVCCANDGDGRREGRGGLGSGDDRDVEACINEGCCDGGSEIPGSLEV